MHSPSIELQTSPHDALRQRRHVRMPRTWLAGPSRAVILGPLQLNAQLQRTLTYEVSRQRNARQSCRSGTGRHKDLQVLSSLTHEHSSHASTAPSKQTSQREGLLAFENTSAKLEDDDDHHELEINDSTVHQVLAWMFSRVGLIQLAAQLRGKAWNAITIACLMAVALLTAWAGGTQAVSAQVCHRISTAATASIYLLAGIPELVDLCFDLTAGHIDTHVLMTLAVFGTLAIGGALEVSHCSHLCDDHTYSRRQQLLPARQGSSYCNLFIFACLAEACYACIGRLVVGVV